MSVAEVKKYLAEGHYDKGGMEPKIRAIIDYMENGSKEALVTNPEDIEHALAGKPITLIVP